MDEAMLTGRLGALRAPGEEASRRRAVRMVSARVTAARRDQGGASAAPRWRAPRRSLLLASGAACLLAALALVLWLGGRASEQPGRAYGAELVRFAESTPLLLLEAPGWRVEEVTEERGDEGQMTFLTGRPVPNASVRNVEGRPKVIPPPASALRRKVELEWTAGPLAPWLREARRPVGPDGKLEGSGGVRTVHLVKLPVLATTAYVNTRAEIYGGQGAPGEHAMTALWSEGGKVLHLSAVVPDLAAFEERLGWLTKVDSETWLDAMPPSVIKANDRAAVVHQMLKGIPLPADFEPSLIPGAGLTTTHDQVAGAVTDTVACLWFRQWGDARRNSDSQAEAEAEQAVASSRHWPILRELAGEKGAAEPLIWQLAAEMPQGYWDFRGRHRRLLAHAESLGCARLGLPLLPSKQKLQSERGIPSPP